MRTLRAVVLVGAGLGLGLTACGDDLPDDLGLDDDTSNSQMGTSTTSTTSPSTSTTTTTTSTSATTSTTLGGGTFGEVDECQVTGDCMPGEFCVAPFDESLGPEGKGLNECVQNCVGIMDETLWCADPSACCDPAAECTDRGYCVVPGESSSGDDSSTDGSDGGSGSDTGTSTGA